MSVDKGLISRISFDLANTVLEFFKSLLIQMFCASTIQSRFIINPGYISMNKAERDTVESPLKDTYKVPQRGSGR